MSYQDDKDASLINKFQNTLDNGGYLSALEEENDGVSAKGKPLSSSFQDVKKPQKTEDEWVYYIVLLSQQLGGSLPEFGRLSQDDVKNLQTLLSDDTFHKPAFYTGEIDGDENSVALKQSLDRFAKKYGGDAPKMNSDVEIEERIDVLKEKGFFKEGEWSVSVQKTGVDQQGSRHAMATGCIVVCNPKGETQAFPFRSGGWGKHGESSMLPGLERDNLKPVSYDLDWGSYAVDSANLPAGMRGADGRGSWLRLGTHPDQLEKAGLADMAERGGVVGQDNSGFFGIHTDGGVPGSLGCIVLGDGVDEQLFAALQSIPAGQRPSEMSVLPPQDVIERNLGAKLSFDTEFSRN